MATNSEVPYCSKCSKSYKQLLENYQTERDNFQKARSEILGYQMSLESLEVILRTHEKNEYAWGDKYEQMEYDLKLRDFKLEEKQKELDQVLKERDDFKGNPEEDLKGYAIIDSERVTEKGFFKKIEERTVREPLELLHMDLFRPVSVESVNRKKYCLVVTDDCSRFSWVFFLAYKDETYDMLHDLIVGLENKLRRKVKTIRCDHGTEFKNHLMNEFCAKKDIKRE
ncbi:putative ribonuclease H-like domain-containing protein [Tanacetum coccineum]